MGTAQTEYQKHIMASHEKPSETDEWYTPDWVFEALGIRFNLDPCNSRYDNPASRWCYHQLGEKGLETLWGDGSVWLNPPFGARNEIRVWLQKLYQHGNGIALVPNRTGADWWQDSAQEADALLFVRGKIRFLRPDASIGASPGYGNILMAYGSRMAGTLLSSAIRGIRV